jgi:hypothetical protein
MEERVHFALGPPGSKYARNLNMDQHD